MRLLIMGPPGVGKGTQAKIIKDKLRIAHISTGELLRQEIAEKTEVVDFFFTDYFQVQAGNYANACESVFSDIRYSVTIQLL